MKFRKIDWEAAVKFSEGKQKLALMYKWSPVIYVLFRDGQEEPIALFGLFSITALAVTKEAWFVPLTELRRVDARGFKKLFPLITAATSSLIAHADCNNAKAIALIKFLGFTHAYTAKNKECFLWQTQV